MNEELKFQDISELSEDLMRYIDLIEDETFRNDSIDFVISKLQELKTKSE